MIERFVRDVCDTRALGTPGSIAADAIAHMSEQVGDEHVIPGLPGGLDSSVTAALPHRAIGELLHYVFVDNGLLRRADAIFIEELLQAGWYDKVAQALTVFLPVRSVDVMGDGRRYKLLGTASNRIIIEIDGISRVTYDISGKPPTTIERVTGTNE